MVSPEQKRRAVDHVLSVGMCSLRRACRYLGLCRSSYFYQSRKRSQGERNLVSQIIALSLQKPTYGYRFITAVLKNAGCLVNHKKVQAVRRKEGLAAKANSRKLVRRGVSTGERKCARFPGDVWCCDFIFDTTEDGRTLKILSVVDELSRFCLVLLCARRINSSGVIDALEGACQRYGRPGHIRSDNGSEFVAEVLREWTEQSVDPVKTLYIDPGSPWQNPWAESFHSRLRNDCLNRELFVGEVDAQVALADWQDEYNCQRPHSGIGYKSPVEVFLPKGPGSSRATPSFRRNLLIQNLQPIPALT